MKPPCIFTIRLISLLISSSQGANGDPNFPSVTNATVHLWHSMPIWNLNQTAPMSTQYVDSWNAGHPLMAISNSERPHYWERPLPEQMSKYINSIREYELDAGQGDASILTEGKLSPETVMQYLLSYPNGARSPTLQARAMLFVLPGMPGDPKISVGAKMRLPNGEIDKYAGKNYGNWQAGYLSYAVGVPSLVASAGAGFVQIYQDIKYLKRYLLEGGKKYRLDHLPGFDDPAGKDMFAAGRDYAFRQEYRKFLKGELFNTSPSPALKPAATKQPNAPVQMNRQFSPGYIPRERPSIENKKKSTPSPRTDESVQKSIPPIELKASPSDSGDGEKRPPSKLRKQYDTPSDNPVLMQPALG